MLPVGELLLELLSEEMPESMQGEASRDLFLRVNDGLKGTGFKQGGAVRKFRTPRRLILSMKFENDDSVGDEKRRGPRVGVPQEVIDKVCNSWGIKRENLYEKDGYYFAQIKHEIRTPKEVLVDILPDIIRNFPWEKSMLWGDGDFRWVRPLHSITAVFAGEPVVFEVGGIKSGNTTYGHFSDPTPIVVKDFADYQAKLKEVGIIIEDDFEFERIKKIRKDAQKICDDNGLELIECIHLTSEISGLVESPFCIMGRIDKEFLDLPDEVLETSMKTHQKFLSVKNPKTGRIENFITVANKHKPSKSAQQTILAGNQKVLSARLADAVFFWENDLRIAKNLGKLKNKTSEWEAQLEKMTFHNKLGTQVERVNRIIDFARTHADFFGVKPDDAETTAKIMKLDLCSDMVKEFPKLQGIMGRYYAQHAGYSADIATACKEHYAPLGQDDITPTASLSVLMALADKLDTLAGFWAVGLTPTSSKDVFALRRAALGVIRLILDNNMRLSLTDLLDTAFKPFANKAEPDAQDKLIKFFHERLKNYLGDYKKEDIPADTIDACRFGQGETDFALLTNRAKALHAFRPDAEFQNLLQGFKRAHNILHAEQKKDGVFYEMPPEPQYFQDPTETELYTALNAAETALPPLMEKEQFAQMLQTLANLRAPIDAFFTEVQVNSDQSAVRRNRLCLLHKLCSVMKTFADFSRLNG